MTVGFLAGGGLSAGVPGKLVVVMAGLTLVSVGGWWLAGGAGPSMVAIAVLNALE